jgi:intracellular septation protein A
MKWNKWIRTTHRWVSLVFTAAVILNVVAMLRHSSATWVGFLALAPLALLLPTGLYLFLAPYAAKRRAIRARSAT